MTSRCFTRQHATVIWVVRDLPLAEQFVTYVVALAAYCSHHHFQVPFVVKLYFTSGGNLNLPQMLTNALAAVEFNLLSAAAGGDALQVHFGRPDFEAELLQAGNADTFYCGPSRFGEIVATACAKHLVPLHPESYANGAYGNIWPRGLFGRKKNKKNKKEGRKESKPSTPTDSVKKARASVFAVAIDTFSSRDADKSTDFANASPKSAESGAVPGVGGRRVPGVAARPAHKPRVPFAVTAMAALNECGEAGVDIGRRVPGVAARPAHNPRVSFAVAAMAALNERGEAGVDIGRLRIKEGQVSTAQNPALGPTSGVIKPPLMENRISTV